MSNPAPAAIPSFVGPSGALSVGASFAKTIAVLVEAGWRQKVRRAMRIIALWPILLTSACATDASGGAGLKPSSGGAPEPSAEIAIPTARGATITALLATLYPWPDESEGREIIEIEVDRREGGPYVATVIRSGLLDDSIAATKDVLTFAYDKEWRVIRAEQYRKCYRTGLFEWTVRPCP